MSEVEPVQRGEFLMLQKGSEDSLKTWLSDEDVGNLSNLRHFRTTPEPPEVLSEKAYSTAPVSSEPKKQE